MDNDELGFEEKKVTYVIGINQLGVNAIICDTRVTWWRSNTKRGGANISLKSGLLFPGCIYAMVGDSSAARSFIINCKQYLTGKNSLVGFWADFLDFVHTYGSKLDKTVAFYLMLSSRHSGKPEFYVFDSIEAVVRPQGNLVTLGSGKTILDAVIHRLVDRNSKFVEELLIQHNIPQFTFPYFYCLWLNEIAQGMELSKLEEYDVGGIFHFLWQDAQGEHAQHPAVYVLSTADVKQKTIYSWIYRVVHVEGALVVENPIINAREVMIDTAARPSLESEYRLHREELMRRIKAGADSQPYYYFCGFGFSDPKHRGDFGMHVTTKNDFVVRKDGWIAPRYKALMRDKFLKDYTIKLENES